MGRPRKSDAAVSATREAMVETARRVIAAEGLGGLTARRLASEVGCAVGSIYTNFPNLDAVIRASSAQEFAALQERVTRRREEARARGLSPQETLLELSDAYLDFTAERGRLWSAIFEHVPADSPPEAFRAARAAPFLVVEEVLREIASPERAEQGARALWAALHGVDSLARAGHLRLVGAQQGARDLARDLVASYVAGLGDKDRAL